MWAEAAKADDTDLVALANLEVTKRGIGGDAGAQKRRDGLEIEAFGHVHDETLLDNDLLGIAAEGERAVGFWIFVVALAVVIGEGRRFLAILLEVFLAGRAFAAGVDHAADTGPVADLQLLDMGADFHDLADDLVAGHHRVERVVPVVANLMEIGVADAGVENLDLDIVRAGFAPLEIERDKRRLRVVGGIAFDFDHGGILESFWREKAGRSGTGVAAATGCPV